MGEVGEHAALMRCWGWGVDIAGIGFPGVPVADAPAFPGVEVAGLPTGGELGGWK